jgi:hypothetical protein
MDLWLGIGFPTGLPACGTNPPCFCTGFSTVTARRAEAEAAGYPRASNCP